MSSPEGAERVDRPAKSTRTGMGFLVEGGQHADHPIMTVREMMGSLLMPEWQKRRIRERWERDLPRPDPGTGIPRLIHQTAKSRALPPELQDAVDRARSINPAWTHILYDDADCRNFILRAYGESVLGLYDRINPAYGAARADLFRYLVVYYHGGLYADIKTLFQSPLDEALRDDDTFIISSWDNGPQGSHPGFGRHPDLARIGWDEIQQWFIISSIGHPFLRAVIVQVLTNIEAYRRLSVGVGKIGVLRTTGPIAYTKAIVPIIDDHPHRRVENEKVVGLAYSIGGGYDHKKVLVGHYSDLRGSIVL